MQNIFSSPVILSSGNIALYPSMAKNKFGEIGIAWYEYKSKNRPVESDIWFVKNSDGIFSKPLNISDGISYNNGPSLIWNNNKSMWMCAWHSWRAPGKPPFSPEGDVTNIWAREFDSENLYQSYLAVPSIQNSEYASLVLDQDKLIHMMFNDRNNNSLKSAYLSDKGNYFIESNQIAPYFLKEIQFFDWTIDLHGKIWITYKDKNSAINLVSKDSKNIFTKPLVLSNGIDFPLSRPKISICDDNKIWITCHSDFWGAKEEKFNVRVVDNFLTVKITSDKSPGNEYWTFNAISIKSKFFFKCFSFGPDSFAFDPLITPVSLDNSLYTETKKYGFETSPKSQFRKLGNNLTRGLFFDNKPGIFKAYLPNGDYEISLIYSSWVAPTKGTNFIFNNEILDSSRIKQPNDSVYILKYDQTSQAVDFSRISSINDRDENRPSKLIHDKSSKKKYLAWTRFGPKSIDIVYESFECL